MVIPYAVFILWMASNSQHPPWDPAPQAYTREFHPEPCTIRYTHHSGICARVHAKWHGHGSVFGP